MKKLYGRLSCSRAGAFALLMLMACIGMRVYAFEVRGRLCDGAGSPLSGLTLRLVNEADSAAVAVGTMSDEEGRFAITAGDEDANPAEYALVCRGTGYREQKIAVPPSGMVGDVVMEVDETMLPEVEVVRDRVNFNPNGFSADLSGSRLAAGKNAPELLGYLPGVSYDRVHGLEVICRAPAAVYIDGVKIASMEELLRIPATEIKRVEVDYQGGVEESATGTGAVIRVTLRPVWDGTYRGYLYGLARAYVENPLHSVNFSPNFKLKKGRFSMSNTAGAGYQRLHSTESNDYIYHLQMDGAAGSGDYEAGYTDRNRGHFASVWDRFSMNYALKNSGMLGASAIYTHTAKEQNKTGVPDMDDLAGQYLATPERDNNVQAAVTLRMPLGEGGKLNAGIDYIMDETWLRQTFAGGEASEVVYRTAERSYTHLLKGKADATLPLWRGSVNAGVEMRYNRITDRYEIITRDEWQRREMNGYSPAAFAQYSGSVRKLSYSVGARLQGYITDVKGGTDEVFHREQWGVCPSADLMYNINQNRGHFMTLGYYYTLGQLPYTLVMTMPVLTGPHSYTIGNRELKASRSHGLTMMARFFSRYTLSARYVYSVDEIEFQPEEMPGEPGMLLYTPYNSDNSWGLSVAVEGNFMPLNWWMLTPKVRMSKNRTATPRGVFSSNVAWRLSLSSNMQLPHDMGLGLMYEYEGESRFSEVTMKPVSYLYAQYYKYFLNKTLQFTADLTLYQTRRTAVTTLPGVTRTYFHNTRNETIELGLVWFFHGGKKERVNTEDVFFQQLQQIPNTKL